MTFRSFAIGIFLLLAVCVAMAKIKRFFLGMIVGAATSSMLGAFIQLAFPK